MLPGPERTSVLTGVLAASLKGSGSPRRTKTGLYLSQRPGGVTVLCMTLLKCKKKEEEKKLIAQLCCLLNESCRWHQSLELCQREKRLFHTCVAKDFNQSH